MGLNLREIRVACERGGSEGVAALEILLGHIQNLEQQRDLVVKEVEAFAAREATRGEPKPDPWTTTTRQLWRCPSCGKVGNTWHSPGMIIGLEKGQPSSSRMVCNDCEHLMELVSDQEEPPGSWRPPDDLT